MKSLANIIEDFGEISLKNKLYDNLGRHQIDLWESILGDYQVEYYNKSTDLTYPQRRQLFLELVEYYMQKGLLKFQSEKIGIDIKLGTNSNGEPQYASTKSIFWNGDTATIKETIEFLDKYMPIGDEVGFNEDCEMMNFFYITCPNASYWYDGTHEGKPDPDYPDPCWVHSS